MDNGLYANGYHNYDFNGDRNWTPKSIKRKLEYLDTEIQGYGQPVTSDMFLQMLQSYLDFIKTAPIDEVRSLLTKSIKVTFGKESLFLLLMQKGCEGVSFYWGINDQDPEKKRLTLLAAASNVDSTGIVRMIHYEAVLSRQAAPIRHDTELEKFDTSEDPLIIEVVPDGIEAAVDLKISDLL